MRWPVRMPPGRRAARQGLARAALCAALGAGLGALHAPAAAALLTLQDSDTLSSVTGGTIQLDRFKPSLGRLVSVKLEADLRGEASDFDSAGSKNSVEFRGLVRMDPTRVLLRLDTYILCAPSDCPRSPRTLQDQDTWTTTDAADLAWFTAGADTFSVDFSTGATGARIGSFTAHATVTYGYETVTGTVPEPASMSLAALALAAVAGARRPRRGQAPARAALTPGR